MKPTLLNNSEVIDMILQDIKTQISKLPTHEKWQLVQSLLDDLKQSTYKIENVSRSTYPLRDLPIVISDDFDEPMPELWETLAE